MRKSLIVTVLFAMVTALQAQTITRVEPSFWWVGMKNPKLQLLVYGDNIASADISIASSSIVLSSVVKVSNPNYLFLNLEINEGAKAGLYDINFNFPKQKSQAIRYELKERMVNSAQRVGFGNADVVYLIMPDRFANGDASNDNVAGMPDALNRGEAYGRHGGDIQGIIDHLDYLSNLGVTSLWLTPVLECNQPLWSYHGYAITNLYQIDARMGSNSLYCELVEKAHAKGLKIIKDLVFNHLGNESWLIKDLPSADWVNQWPEFTRTNYRIPAIFDIHASESEGRLVTKGWFDTHMADLNQSNPLVSTYLIQATIWWIEYANLDGIRVDTEPYCDRQFVTNWNLAVMDEYPNFNIVGETWINYPDWVAYWQKDANNIDGYNSQTPTVMDFPLMYAVQNAFAEKPGWDIGLCRLYEILAHDFVYRNPNGLLIFADNHDVGRIRRDSTKSYADVKMALAFLLTTRGIPQIYYGTEVGMFGNDAKGHGDIRRDFMGGWESDTRSAFTPQGRNTNENDLHSFVSKLLNWRKGASAVHSGKLTHFIPDSNVYVYFRYNEQQKVMVVINSNSQAQKVGVARFNELIGEKSVGVDVVTGRSYNLSSDFTIDSKTVLVLDITND